jgi:hypothetical protein
MAEGGEEKAIIVGLKNDAEKAVPKIAEQHGSVLDSAVERGGKCLTAASENETAITEKVTAELPKDPATIKAGAGESPGTVPEETVKGTSLQQKLESGDDGRATPNTPTPKYDNQALRDSPDFNQEIDEALRNRSITREQYDRLRVQPTNDLSAEQIDDVVAVRNTIRIHDGQMVTKVLHPDVYRAYMGNAEHMPDGKPFDPTQWGGSIARGTDTADLTTPGALRQDLALDDAGAGWSPVQADAASAYQLRLPAPGKIDGLSPTYGTVARDGADAGALQAKADAVAQAAGQDAGKVWDAPFTGTGYTQGGVPEWIAPRDTLPDGAEIWQMNADGTESAVGYFDQTFGKWRPFP